MDSDDKSPCINVCQLTPTRSFCIGCGRTPEEIATWLKAGRGQKLEIKQLARQRLEAAKLNKD
jgi:predicted Fe-S protein YdhL (DUF1289 family)